MKTQPRTRRKLCGPLVLLLWVLAQPVAVHAQGRTYGPRDLALLPAWCKYTHYFRDNVPGGNDTAEIVRWNERTKGMFQHLHHYCWGLMDLNFATYYARSRQDRQFRLSTSVQEFDYVIRQSPRDFPLLPEILTKKGESLVKLGRVGLAIAAFEAAIELKPDYPPAYIGLSDYYKQAGDIPKARQVLERGLTVARDSKALQEQLSQLEPGKARKQRLDAKPVLAPRQAE